MIKDPYHWFPNLTFGTLFVILIVAVTLGEEIIRRVTHARAANPFGSRTDRGSFIFIVIISQGALFFALLARYLNWGVTAAWVQYLGLALLVMGTLFREWAVIVLGRNFSQVVQVDSDLNLVTRGPYRWLRHPAYTGMLILYLGVPLALGTWVGALVTLVTQIISVLYRIRVEEQALLSTFGEEYRRYMQHTWRLIPGF